MAILRASPRKRLWLGAGGVALFIASIFAGRNLLPNTEPRPPAVGVDFIAFYTAGAFARQGRAAQAYDLHAVQQYQHELAAGLGVDLGKACGPWWNPPFYALVFVPLSYLPYLTAIQVWILINLLCAAIACRLLVHMLPPGTPWKTWALVPVLLALSTPFFNALSHAQNSCTSLLLLAATVTLWRSARRSAGFGGFFAGAVGGLLFYKPQLGAVLAAVLVLDLGWRAAAGFVVTGALLLTATLFALPGALHEYLHRMPANLHLVQTRTVYLWERHVTFEAFWRLLLQGRAVGEMNLGTKLLAVSCMLAAGGGLLVVAWQSRAVRSSECSRPRQRDRLIAATIALTPLLVPFYFDYDLLLLAVPAVLFAAEFLERDRGAPLSTLDRLLITAWSALYLWLMVNPAAAERTRVNLAVPLLAAVASLLLARVNLPAAATEEIAASTPAARPLAA